MTYALSALFLTGAFALAQDTAQVPPVPKPAPRKAKIRKSDKQRLTVENESVKVVIDQNGIVIQKPSGEVKSIALPPKEALQMARLKALEAQKQLEKSGFVLGDSVFLENQPEEEKSYRARISSGDKIVFGRTIRVEEDEEVTGDLVDAFGRVEIDGKVDGDVVAPFGSVYLGPRSEVRGDVVSGRLEKADGAVIRGTEVTVGVSDHGAGIFRTPRPIYHGREEVPSALFVVFFVIFGISVLISVLTWALVPHRVENARVWVAEGFFKSFFLGFLGQVLLIPAFVLLCVTIIGIPVALILLLIAFPLACFLGCTAFDLALGERLKTTFHFASQSRIFLILLGEFISYLPILAGTFLMVMIWSGAPFAFGLFLFIFGLLARWVAATAGLGAVIGTRFGGRAKIAAPAPAPPPTPITPQPSTPTAGV